MRPALAVLAALAAAVAAGATVLEVLAADDACPSTAGGGDPSCSLNALQAASRQHRPRSSAPSSTLPEVAEQPSPGLALAQRGQRVAQRHGIKVIGAGLPKTGTSSLKMALDRLGYHTVHGEFLDLSMFSDMWSTWQRTQDPWPVINTMLDMGYDAVADRPWCWVYKELLTVYPDAKVILTHYPRGGEAWSQALDNWTLGARDTTTLTEQVTNHSAGQRLSNAMFAKLHDCWVGESTGPGGAHLSAGMVERCRGGYERWIEEVRANVPPAQLLEYNVTQGWEPICHFLEIQDCPTDEPFPNIEVHALVKQEIQDMLPYSLNPDGKPPPLPLTGPIGLR